MPVRDIRTAIRNILPILALMAGTLACGSSSSATPERVNTAQAPATVEAAASTEVPAEKPTEAPKPTTASATETPQRPTTFEVGDAIELGDYVVVVLGWEPIVSDNQFIKPDDGNVFIGVDLIVVNVSETAQSVSSLLSMSLKDSTDQVYRTDFSASSAGNKGSIDGTLLPGERMKGQVGFQVPEGASGFVFVFDAELFDAGRLFVNLPAEAGLIDAPSAVEGEQTITGQALGAPVEAGAFLVTVNAIEDVAANQFNKPAAGFRFIAVDVTIENTSSSPENVSSLMQMYVRGADGQRYSVDIGAAMEAGGDSPEGEIAAGERLRGKVGFQVPEDTTGFVFGFLAGFGDEPIYIAFD